MSFLPPFYVHPAAFASAEPEPTGRWPRTGARESVGSLYRDYASRGPALQRNFYTHARDIYTFPHGFVTQPVDQEHDQPQHYPPPPPPSANNPVEHTYSRVPRPQFCPPSPRQSTILWNPSHSAPNDYHARRHVQSGWQQVCDSSEPMNSEDGSPRYRRGGMCDGRSLPQEPSGQYRTDTNASSTNRVRQAAAAWTNGQSTEAQYRSVFARESLSLAAVIPDPRLALGEGSSEANIAVPDDTATERSRPVAEPQTTLPATSAQEGDVDSPFGKVPPTPRVAPDELEYWISPREGAEYPRPPPEIQTHAEAMTWLNQQHRLRQDLPPVEDLSAVQQQEGLGIVVNAAPAQGLHETDDRNAQLSPMQILVTPADAGESDFTSQPPSQSTEGQVARNAMDHKATHVPRAGKERAKEEVVAEEAEVGIPGDIYDYHNRVPSSTLNKDRRATNFSTHPPSKLPPGYIKSKLLEPPGHRNTEVNFSASENDDGVEELVDGCMRDTDNILEVSCYLQIQFPSGTNVSLLGSTFSSQIIERDVRAVHRVGT